MARAYPYEPLKRVSERELGWYDPVRKVVDYQRMYPSIVEDEPLDELDGVGLAAGVLEDILGRLNLRDGMYEQDLREIWSRLVGEFLARYSEPVSFMKGVLVVRVSEATVRSHLIQMNRLFLEKLQMELGKDKIRGIRIQLG